MLRTTTKTTLGSAVYVAALLCGLLPSALGQVPRAAQIADEFTVTAVSSDNRPALQGSADVDLGGLSYNGAESARHGGPREAKAFSITRHLRLRVTRRNGAAGVVMVSAYLVRSCSPCKLRLDGVELKSGPAVVMLRALLNETTDHRLDIVIPASMPAGAVDAEIGWQVEER